jgi:hypothetical protein
VHLCVCQSNGVLPPRAHTRPSLSTYLGLG